MLRLLSFLIAPPRQLLRWHATVENVRDTLSDQQLVLNFACFGYKKRDCLLTLDKNGSVTYSAGMVSREPGDWRVVNGDPSGGEDEDDVFLEFTQPVDDLYMELYNVPGGVVYWRGKVDADVTPLAVNDGVAISDDIPPSFSPETFFRAISPKAILARLQGAKFVKEGTFSAFLVTDDDPDNIPQAVDLVFDDLPVADDEKVVDEEPAPERPSTRKRRNRKKAAKASTSDKGF